MFGLLWSDWEPSKCKRLQAVARSSFDSSLTLFRIEKTNKNKSHTCWLVDAIDNTLNFSRGLENFCLSIALKEKGEIDVCLFYDPLKDEIFFFQKGYGGHKNDSKIRVSEKKEISESIIGINNKYENTNDIYDICFTRELLYKKSV